MRRWQVKKEKTEADGLKTKRCTGSYNASLKAHRMRQSPIEQSARHATKLKKPFKIRTAESEKKTGKCIHRQTGSLSCTKFDWKGKNGTAPWRKTCQQLHSDDEQQWLMKQNVCRKANTSKLHLRTHTTDKMFCATKRHPTKRSYRMMARTSDRYGLITKRLNSTKAVVFQPDANQAT